MPPFYFLYYYYYFFYFIIIIVLIIIITIASINITIFLFIFFSQACIGRTLSLSLVTQRRFSRCMFLIHALACPWWSMHSGQRLELKRMTP